MSTINLKASEENENKGINSGSDFSPGRTDSLLRSLNPPESDIDKKWASVAKQRLKELKSGKTAAVPGDAVFEKIWKRFP